MVAGPSRGTPPAPYGLRRGGERLIALFVGTAVQTHRASVPSGSRGPHAGSSPGPAASLRCTRCSSSSTGPHPPRPPAGLPPRRAEGRIRSQRRLHHAIQVHFSELADSLAAHPGERPPTARVKTTSQHSSTRTRGSPPSLIHRPRGRLNGGLAVSLAIGDVVYHSIILPVPDLRFNDRIAVLVTTSTSSFVDTLATADCLPYSARPQHSQPGPPQERGLHPGLQSPSSTAPPHWPDHCGEQHLPPSGWPIETNVQTLRDALDTLLSIHWKASTDVNDKTKQTVSSPGVKEVLPDGPSRRQ